jgi:hypothetical protein
MAKDKTIDNSLDAIWPMVRKNELYTKEMFIQDMKDNFSTLIREAVGKDLPEPKGYSRIDLEWLREIRAINKVKAEIRENFRRIGVEI